MVIVLVSKGIGENIVKMYVHLDIMVTNANMYANAKLAQSVIQ